MTKRAPSSGNHLDKKDAAIIKGMILRGDRQHDIASYFGVNSGRISEISTGKKFIEEEPAELSTLPKPGPCQRRHAKFFPFQTHIRQDRTEKCGSRCVSVHPNYCYFLRKEAHKVWSDMSDAENFKISRYEETTTDELLLSLARKRKEHGLEIMAYKKNEEYESGADWAIWFPDSSGKGIGARIQAKRLSANSAAYDTLFHQSKKQRAVSNSSVPNQCETLLTHNDGLVPLYVFYNSDHFPSTNTRFLHAQFFTNLYDCICSFQREDWGISAASALAIKEAKWGKNNKPGHFPMIPWHRLVCACCMDSPADASSLPSLIGHRLHQLYKDSIDDSKDSETVLADLGIDFEPTDDTPKWVHFLRECRETKGGLDETMVSQKRGDSPREGRKTERSLDEEMKRLNLKGVVIFKEAEKQDV